jgi:tetratricopeptide (TPR) repeat protein
MKKRLSHWAVFSFLTIGVLLNDCVSFENGWNVAIPTESSGYPEQILEKVTQLESEAASAEAVEVLLNTLKELEKADPANYFALWKIGNYNILLGAAYSDKKRDKKKHYREAIQYCEKAMFTNEDFKSAVLDGADICAACSKLTLQEIDAMGYWYTSRFYYFIDCLSPLGRLFNTRIVIDNNTMIERIDQLDSTWAGGGNYFSRALYYIAVPERFGGSKARAEQEFGKAIETGPNYLVNRWGRAKYLYSITGNKAGFVSDMEWVLLQDPRNSGNPYPWNIYFQEDARSTLAGVDDHVH